MMLNNFPEESVEKLEEICLKALPQESLNSVPEVKDGKIRETYYFVLNYAIQAGLNGLYWSRLFF